MDPNTQRLLFGAAGAAGGDSKTYIEDLFSTYVYQGTGSSQTITNGIDLAGKGGLVWTKARSSAFSHELIDSARGTDKALNTDSTSSQYIVGTQTFLSNGFRTNGVLNADGSGVKAVTWTFRKAAKFFDVVTAVADGNGRVSFNHSLGVNPGCVFVKRTDGVSTWWVYHRSLGGDSNLRLNGTNSVDTSYPQIFLSASTNFVFTLGVSGATYVAYLFAHDTTADGMIQCGSFTTYGSGNATVSLGWEPQWLLVKKASTAAGNTTDDWFLYDTMRGASLSDQKKLASNTSDAESSNSSLRGVSSTGFNWSGSASATYIYIAIRRGPMKTPTSGASVFAVLNRSGTGSATTVNLNLNPDTILIKKPGGGDGSITDKLRGSSQVLIPNYTGAEFDSGTTGLNGFLNTGYSVGGSSGIYNSSGQTYTNYAFRRAPGFFDVVAGTSQSIADQRFLHNLSVPPDLIIHKSRSEGSASTGRWCVYASSLGINKNFYLDNGAPFTASFWGNSSPTASDFGFSTNQFYAAGATLIFYLFASCPGVSKVGFYTGTGAAQQIDCGFTNGARFVLLKRADATGNWGIWDTARGIVVGIEPFFALDNTTDYVDQDCIDPYPAGFKLNSIAFNNVGGSFIYLAIS